jgi:hypothetical protein
MAVSLKRKLYSRGGSFETTIPIQMLFSLDLKKKHNVIFEYDKETNRWYVHFEEEKEKVARRKSK